MKLGLPMLVALAWLALGCGSSAAVLRERGRVCEPLDEAAVRGAAGSGVAARQIAACAARRGELGVLVRRLRSEPESAGRDHALGLALAAGGSSGWAEAERRLSAAFRRAPMAPGHALRLGLFLLEAEEHAAAVEALRVAVELEPADSGARVALAGALLENGRKAELRAVLRPLVRMSPSRRDVERGSLILRKAFGIDREQPEKVRAIVRQASVLLGTDDDAGRALSVLEPAVERWPDAAALRTLFGLAHLRLGNRADATASFLRASDLDPEVAINRQRLGELYAELGQTRNARRELEAAIQLDPLSRESYAALGELAYRERSYAEAVRHFRSLAALDGQRTETMLALGRALMAASRHAEAARVYERLIALGGGSYEAYMRLGEIYVQRRLTARTVDESERCALLARRYLARALDARPQDPLVRGLLGQLDRAGM